MNRETWNYADLIVDTALPVSLDVLLVYLEAVAQLANLPIGKYGTRSYCAYQIFSSKKKRMNNGEKNSFSPVP